MSDSEPPFFLWLYRGSSLPWAALQGYFCPEFCERESESGCIIGPERLEEEGMVPEEEIMFVFIIKSRRRKVGKGLKAQGGVSPGSLM